ncbi:hypothetical protein FIBSPDRAFT_308279 [Athelia psychrophila]|uniref:Uncharacterized protein n=1 Tax=Athelia psychrophila TaxID=1759441 RepID=A0A166W8A1_9AGAM|nr:hypothetical protein FIBSPDRAFT_308279 [Fibularhizoctonia sp. CBS 109695]
MIFILLFLHYLATLHADALPTPAANVSAVAGFVNISPSCKDLGSCRELSDIIKSCLTTIFACIWFANHPDIPPPNPRSPLLAKIMAGYAAIVGNLFFPDMMLVRAMRQFISAGEVARKLNDIHDRIEQEEKTAAGESNDDKQLEEGDGDGAEDVTIPLVSRENPQAPIVSRNNPASTEKRSSEWIISPVALCGLT